jgi:prevent-host-death family protein
MRRWQLQQAKAQLSGLVKSCQDSGPQEISVRGESAAVVLSMRDYDRLRKATRPGFVAFLRQSPLRGLDLAIERSPSSVREVAL